MPTETVGRRILRTLVAPITDLWRIVQQRSAPPPEELLRDGPQIRPSARFGGMGERELQLRMEQIVDRILSSRHSVLEPARALAALGQPEQKRFLEAGELLAHSNSELAYQFFHFGLPSLRALEGSQWDDWLGVLLDRYDNGGVNAAIACMRGFDSYLAELRGDPEGIALEEVDRLLESLLAGFGGRPLQVAPATEAYTDTDTAYLPERIERCADRAGNFALLKATAAHLWAQARYGTYRADLSVLQEYPDIARARRLYLALESLRLGALLRREMPGIGRILEQHAPLDSWRSLSAAWAQAVEKLAAPTARAEDALHLVGTLYGESHTLPQAPYLGVLRPELAASVMARRVEEEQRVLSEALIGLRTELSQLQAGREGEKTLRIRADPEEVGDEFAFRIEIGDESLAPPPDIQKLLESVMQDRGEIPDEYLEPAGPGGYRMEPQKDEDDAESATAPAPDTYCYPEWDHARQKYRSDWCHLYERSLGAPDEQFVLDTQDRYRRLIPSLRRTFEALREEEGRSRGESDGDEVDLDRFLQAYGDYRRGRELDERLYLRRRRMDRDVAAMFLVDMSGSTTGWINTMVRESLVLLCCALEALDDRYAIYGFSGNTHENCELYPIKLLDERYDARVRGRIGGIGPKEYTRLGVMIRHLTRLLGTTEARSRLLITLSDGKPDDRDGYRGAYGIEDTRQALHEARHAGIHPFCITIDETAMEYLPHMYGDTGFTVVSRIDLLPRKISGIYRRLTT